VPGASAAVGLNDDPSAFLSTIQVGITMVGVLSGAIGEGCLTPRRVGRVGT
jgi:putative hemolysin